MKMVGVKEEGERYIVVVVVVVVVVEEFKEGKLCV